MQVAEYAQTALRYDMKSFASIPVMVETSCGLAPGAGIAGPACLKSRRDMRACRAAHYAI